MPKQLTSRSWYKSLNPRSTQWKHRQTHLWSHSVYQTISIFTVVLESSWQNTPWLVHGCVSNSTIASMLNGRPDLCKFTDILVVGLGFLQFHHSMNVMKLYHYWQCLWTGSASKQDLYWLCLYSVVLISGYSCLLMDSEILNAQSVVTYLYAAALVLGAHFCWLYWIMLLWTCFFASIWTEILYNNICALMTN